MCAEFWKVLLFRIVLFVGVAEKALSKLRQDTFNHLIRLPISFFSKSKVGELNSRISADITLLQETFTTTFAEFIRQIIIIIGGVAFLSYISIKLTLFMLAVFPVIIILAVVFGKKIKGYSNWIPFVCDLLFRIHSVFVFQDFQDAKFSIVSQSYVT